ncbi:tyrosine-type recombinase/integrase [Phycicoccus sonneratiae]|uniref:Site-specific integrase n=1 Tax=Phycicoccus sonneratiae TaxID=2807628 RepID=A0ABS2CQG9_9MICO|nr:site-specific integrase [Phycicoccus sonneraticus]MBM6402142.1 site-specific integrase [Phycicoccus sonneraticus]
MAGRSGFGSVRKLPSGRWQARFLGPDLIRHVGSTTFQTKGDAQAWLAEERRLITLGQWSSPHERALRAAAAESTRRGRTLAVYAEQWLGHRVTSKGAALRPSTLAGYRNSLDVHILPAFGPLPLDEITTAAVRQWRGQFSATGHDAAGAKAYGLLKAILQTAEDDELILRNPCRLKGAGHAAKVRESTALSPGELEHLAAAMPARWRALTLVSGWCGLRIAEAAGLRRTDVDLNAGTLRITQTAQYVGTPARLVIGPPKSDRGQRTIHMPRHVVEAMTEHIDTRDRMQPKDFVWVRADGQPISRHTLLASFKVASRTVGHEGMVWHDLRHTANTLAADAGASQATLQTRMGHADPKVSSIYLHTSTSHDKNLAQALERMAADIEGAGE